MWGTLAGPRVASFPGAQAAQLTLMISYSFGSDPYWDQEGTQKTLVMTHKEEKELAFLSTSCMPGFALDPGMEGGDAAPDGRRRREGMRRPVPAPRE